MQTQISFKVEVNIQDFSNAPVDEAIWFQWVQAWLTYLCPSYASDGCYELSLRLTGDAEIQQLNQQYRQKDQPTDVLAFAALEVDCLHPAEMLEESPLYLGDIVISVDTATSQAQERGHSLALELAWLASHGLLHLLGWDHPDEESLTRMLSQQEDLLQIVGLSMQYDESGKHLESNGASLDQPLE